MLTCQRQGIKDIGLETSQQQLRYTLSATAQVCCTHYSQPTFARTAMLQKHSSSQALGGGLGGKQLVPDARQHHLVPPPHPIPPLFPRGRNRRRGMECLKIALQHCMDPCRLRTARHHNTPHGSQLLMRYTVQ